MISVCALIPRMGNCDQGITLLPRHVARPFHWFFETLGLGAGMGRGGTIRPLHRFRLREIHSGFSLIEVTLALGIVATVLLTCVAMLGGGINQAREATGRMTSAEISSRLMGELQLAEWNQIESAPALPLRYFDQFGEELTGSAAQQDSIYTAQAVLVPDGATLSTGSVAANPHLRKVLVLVSNRPGALGQQAIEAYLDAEDWENDPQLFFFHSILTNMEKP